MGPDKGWEHAISALPAIAAAHPGVVYVMVGATRPDVIRRDGEAYRETLTALAAELGVSDHVLFVDRFVGRVELTHWLEAADVVVAPSTDQARSATGTLVYAMAAGRAVVSTPLLPAVELLADGRGMIVAPRNPAAIATATAGLLSDDQARAVMGRLAYDHTRPMTWWNVAAQYRSLFERVVAGRIGGRPTMPSLRLNA
jgi:glycosyltransferase involved in cell wall biosynthesis